MNDKKERRRRRDNDKIFDQLPFSLVFYEVSIEQAARSAVSSFFAYEAALVAGHDEVVIAGHLHDAMTHCAAVSRFFWPSQSAGAVAASRAAKLRSKFDIDETSALANRDLRNALEHFDERLDDWVLSGPVGPIVATPIIADHSIVDGDFGHPFKVIDPENHVYIVLGEKFEFGPLAEEVAQIFLVNDR